MNDTMSVQGVYSDPTQNEAPRVSLMSVLATGRWLLLLGAILGGGAGYWNFQQKKPVFESTTRIMVVRQHPSVIAGKGSAESDAMEAFGRTHSFVIRGHTVIDNAIESAKLGKLDSIKGALDPAGIILRGLSVFEPSKNSPVLDINYRGTTQQDCDKILAAVLESYRQFLGNANRDSSQETFNLVQEAKDTLLIQLREKETEYRKFRESSPLFWNGAAAVNPHSNRLTEIESARSKLHLTKSQLLAELRSIQRAVERGGPRDVLLFTLLRQAKSTQLSSTSDSPAAALFPLLLEEENLRQTYGNDHPKVTSIKRRIELTRAHLGEADRSKAGDGGEDFISVYAASLSEEIRMLDEKEAELNELFVGEEKQAKALTDSEILDQNLRGEIQRTQALFDVVVRRLDEMSLTKNHEVLKVEVIAPPTQARDVSPTLASSLGMAIGVGLACALGLAYFVETRARNYQSPDEIRAHLQIPVLGHIPVITPCQVSGTGNKMNNRLCTFHTPRSMVSEAYRGIRTSLFFPTAKGQAAPRTIQITSPCAGDGKSTFAANLAISIGTSGKTVVIVDADLRRPTIHRLFGLVNDHGLSSLISDEDDVLSAIQETQAPNVWALVAGRTPKNPAELLTSHKFDELLALLGAKFDYVIIDTPPVLAVTDPCVVAPKVDAVLLALRLTSKARDNAGRSMSRLVEVGANVRGLTVNGIGSSKSSGYGRTYRHDGRFSQASYGNYGSYSYGDYTYGKSYYIEDGSEETTQNGSVQHVS